jgi:cyclopropane fatty-acyl-phospholipid synthase-like methyltransferase
MTLETPEGPLPSDPFHDFYDREDPAYGLQPSAELAAALKQLRPCGRALDLGAGAGRDTLALAAAGLQVTCVDLSERGLQQIVARAAARGLESRVETAHDDVRDWAIPAGQFSVIVGTTVLDHIPAADAQRLWSNVVAGLEDHGLLYIEVHTTDDPGCDRCTANQADAPVSETAPWVVNYFERGQLLRWAAAEKRLRVLRYEERYEWDYTHGPEHKHAKAIVLATTASSDPPWYGHPQAFPRRE